MIRPTFPILTALAMLATAACQAPYSEPDLSILDRRIGEGRAVALGEVAVDADLGLAGSRLLWSHRFERPGGALDEETEPLAPATAQSLGRAAFAEQLRTSGFEIASGDRRADVELSARIRQIELRTELTDASGVEGRRSAVVEVQFRLRRTADAALLASSTEMAWVVLSGADVRLENGRRTFGATSPDPRDYALRAALYQFLEEAPLR